MNYFLFSVISLLGVQAWAQSEFSHESSSQQVVVEQRRAALRSVLKAPEPRVQNKQENAPVMNSTTVNRHLSEQERVDLRQQLGQQPRDLKALRP